LCVIASFAVGAFICTVTKGNPFITGSWNSARAIVGGAIAWAITEGYRLSKWGIDNQVSIATTVCVFLPVCPERTAIYCVVSTFWRKFDAIHFHCLESSVESRTTSCYAASPTRPKHENCSMGCVTHLECR
jgi:hypothetical protein